jgi:hypothetical protein
METPGLDKTLVFHFEVGVCLTFFPVKLHQLSTPLFWHLVCFAGSMKLQALSQSRMPELRQGGHRVRGLSGRLVLRLAGIAFLAASYCCCLEAEEQILSAPQEAQGISTSYLSASGRLPSFTLTLAPEPSDLSFGGLLRLPDDWRFKSIFHKPAESELSHDRSIMLFRKQMPSRYSYHAWAGLRTGYGQFLPDDTVGRSRTNGVGIQDPSWLYLKMSLKF